MPGSALLLTALLVASADTPGALLRQVSSPDVPPQLHGQSQSFFDVSVDEEGRVASVATLRGESPVSAVVTSAVQRWRFEPAAEAPRPRRVLVAAVFRAPALMNVEAAGEPALEPSRVPAELPAPTALAVPAYPPNAVGDGSVVIETEIAADGTVAAARAVGPPTAFDEVSLDAARRWRFRPARSGGGPAPSVAYLVFGFTEPVVVPPAR